MSMTDDRQTLIDTLNRLVCGCGHRYNQHDPEDANCEAGVGLGPCDCRCFHSPDPDRTANECRIDALLAVPVPLLREIAAATKPCETCGQFAGSIHEGQMPGHVYGSNWDWVPCQTCHGSGRVPAVDRAALLAALGMEQVGWGARMKQYDDDDGTTGWFLDQTRTKLLAEYVPVWAARVSEETP